MTGLPEFDPQTVATARGAHLVEASAGTGKTHALGSLYVEVVETQLVPVEELLVVTFGRAATSELRDRMRKRLRERLVALRSDGRGETEGARFVAEQIRRFDQAAIFTIHGFCQRVLVEHAFETHMSFAPSFVEDDRALQAMVTTDVFARSFYAAPEEDWLAAQSAEPKLGHSALATLLKTLTQTPIVHIAAPLRPDGLAALRQDLVAELRSEWARVPSAQGELTFGHLLTHLSDHLTDLLKANLKAQYAWVLVDEYQDTDPVQAGIFNKVFAGQSVPTVFVGDPKQAIYAFRGADVFSYLSEKLRPGVTTHGLATNYRSSPSLVAALNLLYGHAPLALGDLQGIAYQEVRPRPGAKDELEGRRALELVWMDEQHGLRGRKGDSAPKHFNACAEDTLMALVASDIATLLSSSATIDGNPVRPNQVAVLVATNREARAAQEALHTRGVPSVIVGTSSVFQSPMADELQAVLNAVANPRDRRLLKAAMITGLVGHNASAILSMREDESCWERAVAPFVTCGARWEVRGFVAALDGLLQELNTQARLLQRSDGERQLTNLRHLFELLTTGAGGGRLGPAAMAQRLATLRAGSTEDECSESNELRVEADAAALQIMTVHKSKGLEFDVVYCPTLSREGAPKTSATTPPFVYHDAKAALRATLELGDSGVLAEAQEQAAKETFAERAHLVYVALTRARHHVVVHHSRFDKYEATCLAALLHGDAAKATSWSIEETRKQVEALANASQGLIGFRRASHEGTYDALDARGSTLELAARDLGERRQPSLPYRRTSYSKLTQSAHHGWAPAGEPAQVEVPPGLDRADDEIVSDTRDRPSGQAEREAQGTIALTRTVLPSSAEVGTALHTFFEHVDFQAPGEREDVVNRLVNALRRGGQAVPSEPSVVADGLCSALEARFSASEPELTLAALGRSSRLDEMTFDMGVALPAPTSGGSVVTPQGLAAVFRQHGNPHVRAYADEVAQLGFPNVRGYLTGAVDLVFRWAPAPEAHPRWYVVDYKTNHLGDDWGDYAAEALPAAMSANHYVLQYHLYAVALHRHLRRVLPRYAYERDFGGVYYLFVRGMRAEGEAGAGIYHDRPPAALIDALDELLRDGTKGARP